MKFTKTVRLAFDSIMSNKLRSFLTMLGIIIGVGAVIILVSIMDGVTGQVTDAFENFGMNNITVAITSRGSTRYVEPEDMYEIMLSELIDSQKGISCCSDYLVLEDEVVVDKNNIVKRGVYNT